MSPQSMATAADGSTIVTVQGRLKEHSTFWLTNLEASEFVKEIVQFGYRIPFLALPFLHCTWVVKCSAWCMLSLNRR